MHSCAALASSNLGRGYLLSQG